MKYFLFIGTVLGAVIVTYFGADTSLMVGYVIGSLVTTILSGVFNG